MSSKGVREYNLRRKDTLGARKQGVQKPNMRKLMSSVVDRDGRTCADARKVHSREKSQGLVHWTPDFWLQLIEVVTKVEVDNKLNELKGRKWKSVAETLATRDLVSQFSSDALKPDVLWHDVKMDKLDDLSGTGQRMDVGQQDGAPVDIDVSNPMAGEEESSFHTAPESLCNHEVTTAGTTDSFSTLFDMEFKHMKEWIRGHFQIPTIEKNYIIHSLLPTSENKVGEKIKELDIQRLKALIEEPSTWERMQPPIEAAFRQFRASVMGAVKSATITQSHEIVEELKKQE